jgi:MFS family permease
MSRSSETGPPTPEVEAAAGLRAYRRLFGAYATTLLGTGVAVVGLSLLAFELAEEEAGVVIAAALSIKAFAYVVLAPLASALTGRLPRGRLLVGLDLVRAAAILALPFVDALWQLYAAVFVFAAASAAFTPSYQAMVPHLLPDPDDYARALAKSRIASELENALTPAIAAALLLALSLRGLFLTAMAAFMLSAIVLVGARLPDLPPVPRTPLWRRITLGPRLLAITPELRGLAPLHLAAGLAAAMVMINTVGWVQGDLGLEGRESAVALAVFGLGSVLGALAAPGLLRLAGERLTIFGGCALMVGLMVAALWMKSFEGMLGLWAGIGAGSTLALTPAPLLLRRIAPERRYGPLHAGLFSLGHGALLICYPVAGLLGQAFAPGRALALAGGLSAVAAILALRLWPKDDPVTEGPGAPL